MDLTIFCNENSIETIFDTIKRVFESHKVDFIDDGRIRVVAKTNLSKRSILTLNLLTNESNPELFCNVLEGLSDYFGSITTQYTGTKEKLLNSIQKIQLAIGIELNGTEEAEEEYYKYILQFAGETDAIMFSNGNQMVNARGVMILDSDGETELAHDEEREDYLSNERAILRKKRSEKMLESYGFPVVNTFSTIETEYSATIRNVEDILRTVITSSILAIKSEGLIRGENPKDLDVFIKKIIEQFESNDFFEPEERAFINNIRPSERECNNYVWKYESVWVLLWTLGFAKELGFPNKICNVPMAVKIIQEHGSYSNLLNNINPRSKGEILDEADLNFRIFSTIKSKTLIKENMLTIINKKVVFERQKVLSWLRCFDY